MRGLVWLRNNLRLHDNEPLHLATQECQEVLVVYCIDPRWLGPTHYGFAKTGSPRIQFLLQTLQSLQEALHKLGGNLHVVFETPETALPRLMAEHDVKAVFYPYETGTEEVGTATAIEKYCTQQGITATVSHCSTLLHPDDLPFSIDKLPPVFTNFRKLVEKRWTVRPTIPTPTYITSIDTEASPIPSLETLGLTSPENDVRAAIIFIGGEKEGFQRLRHYLWDTDAIASYKETRNGLLGADYSSKFSPWLALGCLSAKTVYEEVKAYEQQLTANESTYWLIFELLWRDYFKLVAMQHGAKLFQKGGIKQSNTRYNQDLERFEIWRTGNTGSDFVDANMRELLYTGFMSNRGRQNVASYLVHDMDMDWRMGAAWFEHCLIDYDVASNYGNWNYIAGIGNDPRPNRVFNIEKQAEQYDPNKTYQKHWLG